VDEDFAADGHAELGAVREVERPLAPRHVLLGEEHLALRPLDGPPIAHPALQRTDLDRRKPAWMALLEQLH